MQDYGKRRVIYGNVIFGELAGKRVKVIGSVHNFRGLFYNVLVEISKGVFDEENIEMIPDTSVETEEIYE